MEWGMRTELVWRLVCVSAWLSSHGEWGVWLGSSVAG